VPRTTVSKVQDVLGADYEQGRQLTGFIRAAGLIVNRVATCATEKGFDLSSDELAEIETWTAAYMYTKSDRVYTSRSTSGASGSFKIDGNPYLEGAKALDPSGCLNAVLNAQRAGGFWLGKPVSDQLSYDERN